MSEKRYGNHSQHVIAPLRADTGFDEVCELARCMATCLAEKHDDTITIEQRRNRREGRIYLDVMHNAYGQTTVIHYSVCTKWGAPVATPDQNETRRPGLTMKAGLQRRVT